MGPSSDLLAVAKDLSCPVCQADMPLSGDEKTGEEVYCAYCGAPCKVLRGKDNDEIELEEDF